MKNRITELFQKKKKDILSIYFSAGYPGLNDTVPMLEALQEAGVDLVEIGIPYSDPICDGPVIQESSSVALKNGMSVELLLRQLKEVRKTITIPLVVMSSFNPLLCFGIEKFCREVAKIGIDGLIIPDLPFIEFQEKYSALFQELSLSNIFLVTPQTEEVRIREFDAHSEGFLYLVSASSTTGKDIDASGEMLGYLGRVQKLSLKNPLMVGFGISSAETYQKVNQHANGAIIGSAFIKAIANSSTLKDDVAKFIWQIR